MYWNICWTPGLRYHKSLIVIFLCSVILILSEGSATLWTPRNNILWPFEARILEPCTITGHRKGSVYCIYKILFIDYAWEMLFHFLRNEISLAGARRADILISVLRQHTFMPSICNILFYFLKFNVVIPFFKNFFLISSAPFK